MRTEVWVPARFNGPAGSGNGGFVCGLLSEHVTGADRHVVEVTLRRPPPLESPMTAVEEAGAVLLLHDGATVAEARVVEDDLGSVDGVSAETAATAMEGYAGLHGHPFPSCFSCGPGRAEGDGLRIFPGPVGPGLVASVWVPHESTAESGDLLDRVHRCGTATTWAALDCVGGWSEDLAGRPCVLGRMAARVDAHPVVGEPHVVVGRLLGREGRRSMTASTLYDADGRVVGTARHTWVQVDPAAFA